MEPARQDIPLILALDAHDLAEAREIAASMRSVLKYLKIGPRLWVQGGARFVEEIRNQGFEVFLDLKLHDIPRTVERAVASAARHGAGLLTLHASGGPEMIRAAAQAKAIRSRKSAWIRRPKSNSHAKTCCPTPCPKPGATS